MCQGRIWQNKSAKISFCSCFIDLVDRIEIAETILTGGKDKEKKERCNYRHTDQCQRADYRWSFLDKKTIQ